MPVGKKQKEGRTVNSLLIIMGWSRSIYYFVIAEKCYYGYYELWIIFLLKTVKAGGAVIDRVRVTSSVRHLCRNETIMTEPKVH